MKFFDFFKSKKENKRGFQGAAYSRLTSSWQASSLSLDAILKGSIRELRNRSRDLSRNNDLVRAFLRAVETNVIGKGIPFQAQVRDKNGLLLTKINTDIESAWNSWINKDSCHAAGTLSFNQIERLAVRSMAEGGEIFIRMIFKKFGKSKIPLGLQLLEGDMLDENFNGQYGENMVRMGVELNEYGRPVAYHFFTRHPGDLSFPDKVDTVQRIRIPADEIIHLFITERPVQTRGFPWTTSALFKLHQLKGYEDASVVKKRAQASVMGFITSPEGELQGDAVQDDQRVSEFEPGKFEYLGPGENVTVPNLGGGSETEFDPFVRAMIRSIASGVGVSYENLSSDYSQSNYSSSRLALINERDNWRTLQEFMIKNFHQPLFERWLELAVMSGAVKIPNYYLDPEAFTKVRWMPRGWEWVDPLKDVNADKEALGSLLRTHSDILAENGKDFEETMLQIKREREFMKELGLEMDITKKAQPDTAGVESAQSQKNPAPNS